MATANKKAPPKKTAAKKATAKKAAPKKGAAPSPKKVETASDRIIKKYGANALIRGDTDIEKEPVSWGSFALDLITGGGIIPGRVTEIYGSESSGKSSLCLITGQQFLNRGKGVYWVDIENSWDTRTAKWGKRLGVDISKFVVAKPQSGEEALNTVRIICEMKEDALVVLDSWAALTCSKEIEASTGDSIVGRNAMMGNQAIRQIQTALNAIDCKTAVLVINQLRSTIGQMGGNVTTPGGWGLKFSAGVRIQLNRLNWQNQQIKGEQVTVGQEMGMKTVKNKTFPPHQSAQTIFYVVPNKYGNPGFDNIRAMIRFALSCGLVRDLPESEKGKKDNGYHFVDSNGEFVRIGRDENQAVFQLNKKENVDLLAEFKKAISFAAEEKISDMQGDNDNDNDNEADPEDGDFEESDEGQEASD